jgi:dynamin 1-like protein
LHCVQLIYDELMKQAMSIVTGSMLRYANLNRTIHSVARQVIADRMVETRQLVSTLIEMEQAHINTNHPHFSQNISLGDMLSDRTGSRRNRATKKSSNKSAEKYDSSSSSNESKVSAMLIEGWLEKKKSGLTGTRWERQWFEIRDRMLIYSKTDNEGHKHSQSSMSLDSSEMINPLAAAKHHSPKDDQKEKNISLNDGSINLLEDQVSFVFSPVVGKQITLRCPDPNSAQKWVHSIKVALSQESWNDYVQGLSMHTRMRSPSATAMVNSGKAKQQTISAGGDRGRRFASHSMSDNDIVQAQVIENLLDSYYDIVKTKVLDSVPKAITLKLVNTVKKTLHGELVSKLYGDEEQINKLLSESEGAQRKRDKLKEVLGLMEEAMHAVNEVQSGI